MAKIIFTITGKEIREKADSKLTQKQTLEILTTVENDNILWNEIDNSIKDVILVVTKK